MKTTEPQRPNFKRTWSDRRRGAEPIRASTEGLIETSLLEGGGRLPLVVSPRVLDLDLAGWAAGNEEFIESSLVSHGGILFRGFALKGQEGFERYVGLACRRPMPYTEGATPRTKLSEKVYTSTEFPPEQSIALHNELTYVNTFPMRIWFYCATPAARGGETPIGDMRGVFRRIRESVRRPFLEKGWMLVRNFRRGFYPTWQTAYHVKDEAAAEEYFRGAGIEFEWRGDGSLRTRQVRPADAVHPRTGEQVWFNHVAFWHVSSLEPKLREVLLTDRGVEDLPYNTFYGDGTTIEDAVVEELREAYRQETVVFGWREGDVLMLDNMLTAHGRMPFEGPRRVMVAMGEPFSRAAS